MRGVHGVCEGEETSEGGSRDGGRCGRGERGNPGGADGGGAAEVPIEREAPTGAVNQLLAVVEAADGCPAAPVLGGLLPVRVF